MDWPGSKAGPAGTQARTYALHSFGAAIGRRSLDERLTPCNLHALKTGGRGRTGKIVAKCQAASRPGPPVGGRRAARSHSPSAAR
jgi:hypothetical protein